MSGWVLKSSAALAIFCAVGPVAWAGGVLPAPGLYTEATSRVTDLLTSSISVTGSTDMRLATPFNPLGLGEQLFSTDSVSISGLEMTYGQAHAGLSTGLGVEARSSLNVGLLGEEVRPRRTRVDVVASNVREFMLQGDSSGQNAAAEILVFAEGSLELERLVGEALVQPGTGVLYAAVSLEMAVYQEIDGQVYFPGSFFGSAVLGSQALPGTTVPVDATDSWASSWDTGLTQDFVYADLSFFTSIEGAAPGGWVVIVPNEPFTIEYTLSVTTFTSYDFEASNAIGWEARAMFGNTATMEINSATDGFTLVELTPVEVPEPGSLALVGFGGLVLLRRRR